jgi:SpoIID/LytB domain protein
MLRLLLATASALALTCAGASSAAPSPASTTTFVITGHGYGHGVGMAQWGAYGYAKNGFTYDQILTHYYQGTALAPAPVKTVRVLLAQGSGSLTISSAADFKVRDGQGAVHVLSAGSYPFGPSLDLRTQASTVTVPLPGPLTFSPGRSPLVLGHPYRGSIELSTSNGQLDAVNVIGLDAYARGVVSQEMPKDWPLEALKAQAVAARSYVLSQRRSGKTFDVYGDTRDQVYGGVAAESASSDQAVAQTKGQVLLFAGKVATTYFSSSSGGQTAAFTDLQPAAKPLPYLVSVSDPYDTFSPYHNWGPIVLSATDAAAKLKVSGLTDIQVIPANGHAHQVVAVGKAGAVTFSGTDVRWALGLRSTWFKIGVLSLSRPAGPATAPGASVMLAGTALRLANVRLEQRTGGGAWQAGPAIQPAAGGSFSVAVTPTVTTDYSLVAGATRSFPLRVPVAGS